MVNAEILTFGRRHELTMPRDEFRKHYLGGVVLKEYQPKKEIEKGLNFSYQQTVDNSKISDPEVPKKKKHKKK